MREICEVLGFNKSTFYYQPKLDPFEDVLRSEIQRFAAAYPTYGYRRIRALLLRQGYTVGYKRVSRLMKEENLSVSVKRVCQTTRSFEDQGPWVNRVENLEVCRTDQVWVGDITYVRLKGHFIYVDSAHGCLHPHGKRGQISHHLNTSLTLNPLQEALR